VDKGIGGFLAISVFPCPFRRWISYSFRQSLYLRGLCFLLATIAVEWFPMILDSGLLNEALRTQLNQQR
jgi:hypothetical protein